MVLFVQLLALSTATAPAPAPCGNTSKVFSLNLDNRQCNNLAPLNLSEAACKAACCAAPECNIWQWMADADPPCWTGRADAQNVWECPTTADPWVGQAVPLVAPTPPPPSAEQYLGSFSYTLGGISGRAPAPGLGGSGAPDARAMWSADDWVTRNASGHEVPWQNLVFAIGNHSVYLQLSHDLLARTGYDVPVMWFWSSWLTHVGNRTAMAADWARWKAQYEAMRATPQGAHLPVTPFGVGMGDEPHARDPLRPDVLTALGEALDLVKGSYPEAITYMNFLYGTLACEDAHDTSYCCCGATEGTATAEDFARELSLMQLDWISSDEYYDVSTTAFRDSYERVLYPHLRPDQRVVLVPLTYYCESATYCPVETLAPVRDYAANEKMTGSWHGANKITLKAYTMYVNDTRQFGVECGWDSADRGGVDPESGTLMCKEWASATGLWDNETMEVQMTFHDVSGAVLLVVQGIVDAGFQSIKWDTSFTNASWVQEPWVRWGADEAALRRGHEYRDWAQADPRVAATLMYGFKNIWQQDASEDACQNPSRTGLGLVDRCGNNSLGAPAMPRALEFYQTLLMPPPTPKPTPPPTLPPTPPPTPKPTPPPTPPPTPKPTPTPTPPPTPKPTPPPTPKPMFLCDEKTSTCTADAQGTQTQVDCKESCAPPPTPKPIGTIFEYS